MLWPPQKSEVVLEERRKKLSFWLPQKVGLDLGTDSQQRHASDDCHWISSCHNNVLMMDKLKKNGRHVIHGMRNFNMDRERQARGSDELNYAALFCK